jgi:hypothetical protein
MALKETLDLVPVFVPRVLKDRLKAKAAQQGTQLYRLTEQLLVCALAEQVVPLETKQRIDKLEATLRTARKIVGSVPHAGNAILYPSKDTLLDRINDALESEE